MFGYIKPNKMELKLKEIYRYRDLYCGLCHSIRTDYGQLYGCALSYDLTFLLVVLNGVSEDEEKKEFRCPLNPLKKKKVYVSQKAVQYSAFMNYFLMYLKIADDVVDDNNLFKKMLQKILKNNKKYQEKYKLFSSIAENLKQKMIEFNKAEAEKQGFDELTNLFGDFFAQIFMSFFEETNTVEISDELKRLCFNLGKWVYLIDAYDDYLKDEKENKFNLLKTMYFENELPNLDNMHHRIYGIMGILVGNMKQCLKNITLKRDYNIVENVISYSCNAQYLQVLKKRYPEQYKQNFQNKECCKCEK